MNASLFGIVMLTGAVLYVGPLSALVGRREIVRTIHVYCGLALPVPLLVALVGRHGARLRRDLGGSTASPRATCAGSGAARAARSGSGSSTRARSSTRRSSSPPALVMVATGSIMKWF